MSSSALCPTTFGRPLAGLRALLEGLEDGVITDVPGALGHMRATVDRMSHLVDDLFELSRVHGLPALETGDAGVAVGVDHGRLDGVRSRRTRP